MLELRQLAKAYGDVYAVRDLSLAVGAGDVYALLGPNGAGKTTALRCLAGVLRPDSGAALVCGVEVARDPSTAQRRLGFLAANTGLYPRLTVREYLAYHGALRGLPAAVMRAEVERVLERFAIGPVGDAWCGALSTGQRQRVALARTVMHDPPVLVLDEPSLGLDVLAASDVRSCVVAARARGCAVLLSTHDMAEVELLADRVGVLVGGRLVAEGTVAELLTATGSPTLTRAFLTLAGARGAAA
jgi:sodium transport system ATP-binding protein